MRTVPNRLPLYATAASLASLLLVHPTTTRPALAANLVQNPERLELWTPWRNASVTPNTTQAPNGTQTADSVVDNASMDGARMMGTSGTWAGGAGVFSVHLKSGSLSKGVLAIRNGVNGAHLAFGIVSLNSNWQRFWVVAPNIPAGSTPVVEIHAGVYDRDNGFVHAWGAQFEPGTTPTPYSTGTGTTPPPTSDTTPPSVPAALSATVSSGKIALSWSPSSGSPSGYIIERGVNSSSSFTQLATSAGTGFTDSSTSAGNSYSYRVKAADAAGNLSATSNVATAVIPTTSVPPPPSSSGALSVLNYGASTAAGNDDTAAIQRCFDAAQAQGKDAYLPAGHYGLSNRLIFRAAGRTVFGDGMDRSIIAGNTNSISALLLIERTQNVTVRDLKFEGSLVNNESTNTGRAIEPFLTTGVLVKRVHSYGTGYLVQDNSATSTTIEDSICQDYGRIGYLPGAGGTVRRTRFICRPSWVFGGNMNGVYVSSDRGNVLVEDNEFIHCGAYAMTVWGSLKGSWIQDILIQNNRFQDCDRAFTVSAGGDGPSFRNIRFLNNTVKNCGEKSVHIGKFTGSNSAGTALIIDGNIFEDAGNDMSIFITNWAGTAPISGVRISNNQFLSPNKSAYYGLWVSQNGASISDVIIENNLFSGIGHYGSLEKGHCGIYLKAGSAIVRGNTFSFWDATGSSRVSEGIRMDSGARNCLVTANQFLGNGRAGTYGFRMTSSGSSANGGVTNNLFRKAKLFANGVPSSGNTEE